VTLKPTSEKWNIERRIKKRRRRVASPDKLRRKADARGLGTDQSGLLTDRRPFRVPLVDLRVDVERWIAKNVKRDICGG